MNTDRMPCGLVLAGGWSRRMGTDKAGLVHADGRTLGRRTVDLLREVGCGPVVLSLRHDQELPEGFGRGYTPQVVRDPEGESMGPLGGMIEVMRSHPDADWLVVACDLPSLDRLTLQNLLEQRKDGEPVLAYRSELDGLPEPLCALYGAGVLVELEQLLQEGIRSPRGFLIEKQCRLLDPVSHGALDNANTPEDWEKVRDR